MTEKTTKKVFLDISWKSRLDHKMLIASPPLGYQFVSSHGQWRQTIDKAGQIEFVQSLKRTFFDSFFPSNLLKSFLDRFLEQKPSDAVLTYACEHLVLRKEPWILFAEMLRILVGGDYQHFPRYKGFLERILASSYCKKILLPNEAAKRTFLANLDCSRFSHKLETVYLAVPPRQFTKKYDKHRVKLLFVNSANIPGQFELKGGREVLETFTLLNQRYPNLELVVRSDMPADIKRKYSSLPNLRIIDKVIPWEELEHEWTTADIFIMPTHITPYQSILDAMSYELPVVTIDVFANAEQVQDGKTGFVVAASKAIPYEKLHLEGCLPLPSFIKAIARVDPEVVRQLADRVSLLIENEELRRQMGRAGRWEIENGKFSINRRNEQLKRIFDEAIAEDS